MHILVFLVHFPHHLTLFSVWVLCCSFAIYFTFSSSYKLILDWNMICHYAPFNLVFAHYLLYVVLLTATLVLDYTMILILLNTYLRINLTYIFCYIRVMW